MVLLIKVLRKWRVVQPSCLWLRGAQEGHASEVRQESMDLEVVRKAMSGADRASSWVWRRLEVQLEGPGSFKPPVDEVERWLTP